MRILVTGASGFVGRALLARLLDMPHVVVRVALRNNAQQLKHSPTLELSVVGDLGPEVDWRAAVAQVNTVVHCAARVHMLKETAADPLAEFRRANVEGTLKLARQAQAAGVKRFVFVSSIKVNGEQTARGQPFFADDAAAPADAYGISKLEAEQGLLALGKEGAMEVVIVRPVLVYGPGVKANFLSMLRWMDKGVPLPLGAIHENRRSLVALDNLVDLLLVCLTHPAAAGQIFLAADGEDLSTTELLRRCAQALGKRAVLLPVPPSWLALAARLLGKPGITQRLCGSLQADIAKNRELLDWVPPVSMGDALKKTVIAYRQDG